MITAGYLPTLGGNPLETSGILFFFNFFFKKNFGEREDVALPLWVISFKG
jgi:hypothetical protein